jgi:hypothetical protein
LARIWIDVEVFDEVLDQLRLLNEKVDALLNGNGHGKVEWLDAAAAGAYLGRSRGAVAKAWSRGTIPSVVSPDGRRRASKQMLDAYQANGAAKS